MNSLNELLTMLKSPESIKRHEACNLLRVQDQSNETVLIALEETLREKNQYVSNAAKNALLASIHQEMYRKLDRECPLIDRSIQSQEESKTGTAATEPKKCPNCAHTILDESIICRHCGRAILHPSTAKILEEGLRTDPSLFLLMHIAEELEKRDCSSFFEHIRKEMVEQTKYLKTCAGNAQIIGLLAFLFMLFAVISLFFPSCGGFY